MNAKKTTLFTLLSLIIGIQSVYAATGVAILDKPFRMLFDIIQNQPYVMYGLVLIFFFSLLYGIYAAALKFVPVFKSGETLSHQGKVVGLSLAALSTLSIFYFTKGSPEKILQTVLDPFGIFGGLVLAALFAGITYFGIRGNDNNSAALRWAAVAAGFGMVIAGMITTQENIMVWGFFIMFVAMIFALVGSRFGKGGNDGGGNSGNSGSNDGSGKDGSGKDGSGKDGGGKSGDGLDYANLGHVFVRVHDEDNTGIADAAVTIQDGHFGRRIFKGRTNANGVTPEGYPANLPSGRVIVVVDKDMGEWALKTGLVAKTVGVIGLPFIKHGKHHVEVPAMITPGTTPEKPQIIPVQLRRKGEKVEHFEPIIHDVKPLGNGKYMLKGEVHQKGPGD